MEKAVSRSEEKEDEFKLGRELWLVAKAALPVIVAEFCRLFMNVIDSIFIGQLGARELAAASLGTSWGWCSLAIPVGLIFALDTFVSQGFGAQNWRLIGASTQTAVFVVTLATIPVALLWWFTEPILLGLRQPPEVVVLTAEYMRWGLPGLWPILFYRLTTRYLMNQWILMPGMVAGIIAVCGNALFNQLFIFWLGLGFKGGPLATSVSRILLPIYLWIYIILRKIYSKTCTGIYREAFTFRAVWEFLKLGIPSMGSLWLETLAYEGVALLVGLFGGDTNLAAYSISYAVLTVSFILPVRVLSYLSLILSFYLIVYYSVSLPFCYSIVVSSSFYGTPRNEMHSIFIVPNRCFKCILTLTFMVVSICHLLGGCLCVLCLVGSVMCAARLGDRRSNARRQSSWRWKQQKSAKSGAVNDNLWVVVDVGSGHTHLSSPQSDSTYIHQFDCRSRNIRQTYVHISNHCNL
jgi:putative MATE family efflux protein